ncbi:mandelate racemase/muconate lactonizing enzyme family protein [Fluviibacterium sp. DFM31]|uniref:Mandelate racemase/muconate lactonizing enzyme family protein n=1 Tax=Meridianimarinicoccus marinus TaxID=3231483 RepID=A0ABV3L743_9RHOB
MTMPAPASFPSGTAAHPISAIRAFVPWVGGRNQLIVKVETETGLYGWGESGLSGREKAVLGALEHFEHDLIGSDAMAIGRIWQQLYRGQYFEGGRVLLAAMSAIDIALHDLKGKALGVPVHDLLGGKQRDRVPTFASTQAGDFANARAHARALKDLGWNCIRLFPDMSHQGTFEPQEHLARSAELCRDVRADLGDNVILGIDWHHRLSVAEAAAFCQKLPSGTLNFIEEPIRDEAPSAYEALRRLTDIPFAVGEEFASKWQFLPFIERDIHQFNRIDICNVGGLTEAMKVAAMSEAHYVDMMPHNPLGPICTAASIHFAAAVPNFAWLETNAWGDAIYGGDTGVDPFIRKPVLNGTSFDVPSGPGLGIEVDETKLDTGELRLWHPPQLRRRDGSVTNW